MMPVEDHGHSHDCGEGLGKEVADPARTVGDQQQRAEWSETQQHGELQVLEEASAHPTQVARAVLGHHSSRAQFQKMTCLGATREHFINGEQHLIGLEFWSEVTQVLDRTGCLHAPCGEHTLPIGPRYAIGRAGLLTRQRGIDCGVKCCWPPNMAPPLPVRHKRQLQAREVIACS
jgi:hypothetical protein